MIFGSPEWYEMVAATIAAIHADLKLQSTPATLGAGWWMAREKGQNAEAIKAYLQSLKPAAPVLPFLPPVPSREAICGVQVTFQGLSVDLPGHSGLPWFEPFLASLNASDRQLVYNAKKAHGDTHQFLSLAYRYSEPGYSYPLEGRDFTNPGWMPEFLALVTEVIQNGFMPVISLCADGQTDNPEGATKGWQWGMSHMGEVLDAFRSAPAGDLTPYCLWMGGYELLGPGGDWTPAQLEAFHLKLRELLPFGHIALELGQGYCHIGKGPADWISPAGQSIDVFLQEFPQPIDQHWDVCQQVAARMLGPAAKNIMKGNEGPWYLAPGTPRGPFHIVAFEWDAYRWVRGQVTSADVERERQRLKSLGYTHLG